MYSQNPVHINTVFLITLFTRLQGGLKSVFPTDGMTQGCMSQPLDTLVKHQATALTLAIRIAQKTRQESRIAAQI